MDYRRQTAALNQIAIREVSVWLGHKLPNKRLVNCPFPDHLDENASFEVKPAGNRWKCYGCDRSGGTIDFVKEMRNCSFLDAKKWLLEVLPQLDESTNPPKIQTKSKSAKGATETEDAPDHQVYSAFLDSISLLESGQKYLESRALSSKTITQFNVKQISEQEAVVTRLLSQFGFERVAKSGLLTRTSTQSLPRLVFPSGSVIFPFYEDEQCTYLQARMIKESIQGGKWRNLSYRRPRIFNSDALTKSDGTMLSVCEGVMDTLSAIELGLTAVGVTGVSASFNFEQIKLMQGREVCLLMDWDEAGNNKARALQRELRRYGIFSTRKAQPSATADDLNEYLVELRHL